MTDNVGAWRLVKRNWMTVAMNLLHTMSLGPPPLPPPKMFSASNPEVPIREDYRSAPLSEWWDHWPRASYEVATARKSNISAEKLRSLALVYQYPNAEALGKAVHDLSFGADIGVHKSDEPLAREASTSTNAPSSYEFGDRVTDSIISWIKKGFCIGPLLDPKDNPWREDICVSGLMVKLKSNGKARVILNLSAGSPGSVNAGIDKSEFPAKMSSTKAWIKIMYSCGLGCLFCKNDWSVT